MPMRVAWLTDIHLECVVQLTESIGLVGHGAWADARLGDFDGSTLMMSDFAAIHDFAEPPDAYRRAAEARGVSKVKAEWLFSDEGKVHRRCLMERLGDEAASHFQRVLPQALDVNERVLLLTHVPPFQESAWCGGNISDDSGLPYFACKAVGDVLVGVMRKYEDWKLTVLCGHVHSGGTVQILDNLEVITGAAEYTNPRMERVFELEQRVTAS